MSRAQRNKRRGFTLIVTIVVTALVAAFITLLAAAGARRYQQLQVDRVRMAAEAAADSAMAYARTRLDVWANEPPVEPVILPVDQLLPSGMEGMASVIVMEDAGQKKCRISSRVSQGRYAASDEWDLFFEKQSSQ